MTGRRIATLLLVPVFFGVERMAYYGMRSVLVLDMLHRLEMTQSESMAVLARLNALVLWIPLLGGALALALGPRVVLVLGAALATLGYALLASISTPSVATLLVGVGVGLMKPCAWAVLADAIATEDAPGGADVAPLSPRRFPLMAAMFLAGYAAINLGAALSPLVMGTAGEHFGTSIAFWLSTGVMLVALALSVVLAVLKGTAQPRALAPEQSVYRAPAAPLAGAASPARAHARASLLGLLALLGAVTPYSVALPIVYTSQDFLGLAAQLVAVNTAFVLVASIAAFLVFLTLALLRRSFPLTWALGGALALFGVGLVPLWLADSAAVWGVGIVLTAVAEPVITAVGLAYAALATGARTRTLLIAGWMAWTNLFERVEPSEALWRFELRGLAAVIVGVGVVLLVFGRRLHASAFEPPVVKQPVVG